MLMEINLRFFIYFLVMNAHLQNNKNTISQYILYSFLIIGIAFGINFILNFFNLMQYIPLTGKILMIIGGLSTAVVGAIVSKQNEMVRSYGELFLNFFNIFQPLKFYILIPLFLILTFTYDIITGGFVSDLSYQSFFRLFLISIVFGGIEEIGWRFTLQPALQRYVSFEIGRAHV